MFARISKGAWSGISDKIPRSSLQNLANSEKLVAKKRNTLGMFARLSKGAWSGLSDTIPRSSLQNLANSKKLDAEKKEQVGRGCKD